MTEFKNAQFLRLCRSLSLGLRPPVPQVMSPSLPVRLTAPDPSLRKRRLARAAASGRGRGGRRGGAGPTRASEVCASPPPRHQRAARARVYVPSWSRYVSSHRQHCGDTEAPRSGDASLRQASSRLSGRRGGGTRSARASGGGSQAQGPDHPPARPALRHPRLTSGAPQTQPGGLARGVHPGGRGACNRPSRT